MKWILVGVLALSSAFGAAPVYASEKRKVASDAQRTTVSDVVKKLRDDDEGIVVLFAKTSGSYYLRRDVAQFESYRQKLQESMASKKPVSVTADSAQLNILEVK